MSMQEVLIQPEEAVEYRSPSGATYGVSQVQHGPPWLPVSSLMC